MRVYQDTRRLGRMARIAFIACALVACAAGCSWSRFGEGFEAGLASPEAKVVSEVAEATGVPFAGLLSTVVVAVIAGIFNSTKGGKNGRA